VDVLFVVLYTLTLGIAAGLCFAQRDAVRAFGVLTFVTLVVFGYYMLKYKCSNEHDLFYILSNIGLCVGVLGFLLSLGSWRRVLAPRWLNRTVCRKLTLSLLLLCLTIIAAYFSVLFVLDILTTQSLLSLLGLLVVIGCGSYGCYIVRKDVLGGVSE
jgi:hypothetical protein